MSSSIVSAAEPRRRPRSGRRRAPARRGRRRARRRGASVVGDRRADAARGAGDQRDLAVERPLPVESPAPRRPPAPIRDDLAGDVGRARREQEAQRSSRARPRRPARRRRAARSTPRPISLPSERVKPSSARCAVALAPAAGRLGGVPSTTTRPQRCDPPDVGWKKRCSSTSSVESAIAGRVEDERLSVVDRRPSASRRASSRPRPRRRAGRRAAACRRRRRAASDARRAARQRPGDAHRPVARSACARLDRCSGTGCGSPTCLAIVAADRRVDELRVAVAHGPSGALEHRDDALAAGRADADQAAARRRARAAPWRGWRRCARRSRRTGGRRRASRR